MVPRRPPTPPEPLPEGLETPLEKLVYLFVRERGDASVRDLRDALDVPQLRLYPILDGLAERDLLERHGEAVRLPEPAAELSEAPA